MNMVILLFTNKYEYAYFIIYKYKYYASFIILKINMHLLLFTKYSRNDYPTNKVYKTTIWLGTE